MPKKDVPELQEGDKVKVLLKIVAQQISELPLSENGSLVHVEWKTGSRKKHRGKTIAVLSREGVASWTKGNELEVQSTLKADENGELATKKVTLRIHAKRGKKKKVIGKTVIDITKYTHTNNYETTETLVMGKTTAPKLRVRFRCFWLQRGNTKFIRTLDESGNLEEAFRVESVDEWSTASSSPHSEGESTATFSQSLSESTMESSDVGDHHHHYGTEDRRKRASASLVGGVETVDLDVVIPSPSSSSTVRKKRSGGDVSSDTASASTTPNIVGGGGKTTPKSKSSIKKRSKKGKKKTRRSRSPRKSHSKSKSSASTNAPSSSSSAQPKPSKRHRDGSDDDDEGAMSMIIRPMDGSSNKGNTSNAPPSDAGREAHGILQELLPPPISVVVDAVSNTTTTNTSDISPRALTSEEGDVTERLKEDVRILRETLAMKQEEINRLRGYCATLSNGKDVSSVSDSSSGKMHLPPFDPVLWTMAVAFIGMVLITRLW